MGEHDKINVMLRVVRVIGILCVALAACGIGAHFSGLVSNTVTRVASFAPVLIAVGILGAVLLLICRSWVFAGIAVVVAAVGVASQAPLYRGVTEQVSTTDLAVMQANIKLGTADPAALVAQVRDARVDVLTVIELTGAAVTALDSAGLRRELPYAFEVPRDGGGGAGIYARTPLDGGAALHGFRLANLHARLDVPGRGGVSVYALHPLPPYPEASWRWDAELRRLQAILAADTQPLIIGADVNSTYDHRPFRDLLTGSDVDGSPQLVDAAEHLGSGIVATYPADRRYPPLLALDRVLTRNGPVPTSLRRIDIPGSDHHGVIVTVRV